MSEPLLPLQTFRDTAGNSTDESAVPFIGRKKQPKPSFWNRTSHALSTFFSGISHPSLELFIFWILCSVLLVLHILAVLRWPTEDYGIRVLRESFDCGSNGTAFLTFLVTIPLNLLATFVAYALGFVAKRSNFILQVVAVLTIIPTHLLYVNWPNRLDLGYRTHFSIAIIACSFGVLRHMMRTKYLSQMTFYITMERPLTYQRCIYEKRPASTILSNKFTTCRFQTLIT
jgi:hypothetical protein